MSRHFAFLLCALGALACSSGASDDPAFSARMRVANAQFVSGATPSANAGPEISALELPTNTIWPGANKAIGGSLGESATAVTLALSSDIGYWIVPAGPPDISAPSLPTFRATADFSQDLALGAYTLEARAVDAGGHFGAPSRQTLTAIATPPTLTVSGVLIVTLSWDTESDLDLHVVDPLGNEIYHGAPSSVDAFKPGSSSESAGILDADSNANCAIDGLRQEDVTWSRVPPSGHYLVRVDTTSLCGAPTAHFTVHVILNDEPIAAASGTSLDSDTRGAHDRGAGLLALGFDVP